MTPDQYVPKVFQYIYESGHLEYGKSLHIRSTYLMVDGFYRKSMDPVLPFSEATDSEICEIKDFCIIVVGLFIVKTKIDVAKATQFLTDNVLSNAVYERGHRDLNSLEDRLRDLENLYGVLHD